MSGISWTVLAGLFRALSVFAPLGGKQGTALQSAMVLAATLLERGEAGRHELEILCAKVDEMVAQGREPTADEWATLHGRSDAAHDAIMGSAAGAAVGHKAIHPVDPPAPLPDPAPPVPGDSEGGHAD